MIGLLCLMNAWFHVSHMEINNYLLHIPSPRDKSLVLESPRGSRPFLLRQNSEATFREDPWWCTVCRTVIHYLEAGDQKVRGGPSRGGSFGAFRSPAIKHFYVLSGRLISRLAGNFGRTRISRWFMSNRRFDEDNLGQRARPSKGRILLNFKFILAASCVS